MSAISAFFDKIWLFLNQFQAEGNILVAAIVILTIGFQLFSDEGRTKVKKNIIPIIIGLFIIFGFINIGASVGSDLKF